MVDVFISYSRANKDKVAQIARAVQEAGFEVWWDAELPPHQSYGDVITAKIQSAKAAIVVWSEEAAASEWVRAEADVARNQKKLVQTALGDIVPPLPFNQIQYANLGDWQGEPDHPEWRKVKASLNELCGPREPRDTAPAYAFPAGSPHAEPEVTAPRPAPKPAPVVPPPIPGTQPAAPAAPLGFAAVPPIPEREPGAKKGSSMPIIIGAGVALLGLAGAGWLVSQNKGEAQQQVMPADGGQGQEQAQGLLDNTIPAPQPTQAPAPAPAPAQVPAPPPQQQQFNRDVRLINQSGDTIMYLYWSSVDQTSWGNDRLGNDVLGNGQYWNITVDDGAGACNYDFKAVTSSGREITHENVNVCSVYEIYFN